MAMTREEMQRLASYGRNGDTMLAHINPQEAALLKSRGGVGTINPKTGLREFWQDVYGNTVGMPTTLPTKTEYRGGLNIQQTVIEPFDRKFADVNQYGMGVQQVTGYTLPSDKTFADIPLVYKYDPKGGFNHLTLEPGKYLTPDPSQPNIISVPRLDASGKVVDWGITDRNNQDNGSFGSFVREVATELGPILSSVLAYYMPGITASLAPSLTSVGITNSFAQSVVSSALTNAVVSVAQGAPLDVALQNAVTNAVVTSGSPAIARDINSVISNPAVTNAIVSAGSSAAITALNGGSESDITRNIIGGLVGSGTASATDNRVIGSFVGGAITGGVAGAITGGVGAYGAEADARDRATRQTSGTSADPGIRVAGGDDATALNMASISAMPDMLGKSGETASPLSSVVEGGQTFYERTITGKSPDGKDYSYTVTYDPGATAGRRVSYSTSGVVLDAQGDVIPSGGGGATASFTRPTFTAKDTGVYTPTIITTGQTFSPSTRTTADTTSRIQSVIDLRSTGTDGSQTQGTTAGTGDTETSTNVGTGNTASTGTFTSSGYSGRNTTGTGTGRGTGTGVGTGRGTGTGTGAGGKGDGTGSGGEGDGTGGDGTGDGSGYGGEGDGTGGGRDLPPVEDRTGTPVPYTPKIFTYGGVESTLPTTLRTTTNIPTDSTTTGTSVGLGGRGEIESKESGKKRKNVWNEESLRLKDALGL